MSSTRQTFVIDEKILTKMQLIAVYDRKQQKEILEAALSVYIEKWEQEHPDKPLNV